MIIIIYAKMLKNDVECYFPTQYNLMYSTEIFIY